MTATTEPSERAVEFLPCPCGAPVDPHECPYPANHERTRWTIGCGPGECGWSMTAESPEAAIAEWNNRPADETIAALRRRVEEVADLLGQPFHIVADRQTVMRAEQMLRAALRQAETAGG
jgi:hypothetical protein